MRFSLMSLAKLTGIVALFACTVAVAIARLEPIPAHFRMQSPPIYGLINGYVLNSVGMNPKFIDRSTGKLRVLSIPEGQRLDNAACSPWLDEQGEYQVVGRWALHSQDVGRYSMDQLGIARYGLPSGRLISKTLLDTVPSSHPCWFPGNASRILYPAADGKLYRLEFQDDDHDNGEPDTLTADASSRPTEIRWAVEPPSSRMMISDAIWITDPKLENRLIVSLSYLVGKHSKQLTPAHLWWLKLNDKGTEIIAASPLDPANLKNPPAVGSGDERHPSLAVTPSGEIAIAYLWQPSLNYGRWDLRLGHLKLDAATHQPTIDPRAVKTLSVSHLGETPRFSLNGEWIFGILRDEAGGGKLARYSTNLDGHPATIPLETVAHLNKSDPTQIKH